MAQVKRKDIEHGDPLSHGSQSGTGERHYAAGGSIAELQADLARRLNHRQAADARVATASPGERLVRFCSIAGGYSALIAGYAVVGLAIAYLI